MFLGSAIKIWKFIAVKNMAIRDLGLFNLYIYARDFRKHFCNEILWLCGAPLPNPLQFSPILIGLTLGGT